MFIACGFLSLLLFASWGFYGHRTINRLAIYALPSELMVFYKAHADYLSEHAVDADKRRYSSPEEAPRHFLDADHYEQELPLDTIPRSRKQAVDLYTEDTLLAYGIGPWHLERMVQRLSEAFAEYDQSQILKLSADIGHYAGDLHVPLHTTENYDGQLSGQKGIHGFWESRLPELFANEYDFYVGRAKYIPDVRAAIWEVFEQSVAARDSVLYLEKELNIRFDTSRKYAIETRGSVLNRVYSREYAAEYHQMLDGMVERRMRGAVYFTACLWYTAWINAGSPDLPGGPDVQKMHDTMRYRMLREDQELEFQRMLGREEPR